MIPDGSSEGMEISKNAAEEDSYSAEVAEDKCIEEPKVNGDSDKIVCGDTTTTPQELRDINEGFWNWFYFNKKISHIDVCNAKPVDDEPAYSSEDEEKLVINMVSERRLEEQYSLDLSKKDKTTKRKCEDEGNEKKKLKSKEPNEVTDSQIKLDDTILSLKKDISRTQDLLYQKEEEWDMLLRQQKKQEIEVCRLLRRKKVLQQRQMNPDFANNSAEENEISVMSSIKSYSNLLKNDNGRQTTCSPTIEPNISVIDISTNTAKLFGDRPQVSISPDLQSRITKQFSNVKPILPKPFSPNVSIVNHGSSSPQLLYPQTGYGPQGPTVSVDHIIAEHRKDHPALPPIRGAKRGAWRHKYDGDKYSSPRECDRPSSVSSSHGDADRILYNKNFGGASGLAMDPKLSFKDVLVQFAQLTQNEKQSTCPQVSIIPVTSDHSSHKKPEPSPDSTSVAQTVGNSLEGSSALAKLLLESRVSGPGGLGSRPSSADTNLTPAPQYLTLSTLLSGAGSAAIKDKGSPSLQLDTRSKKDDIPPSYQKCQGCHQHKAQFVCAGCGNQWYCSRECQVKAWEEHSARCNN